ncbi:hypothetical protein [uncultured Neisseria sp.]|uniref:hypothetical protein n=1 Tax=uncultured Neisseria sp. TaxID=237778 RepID=UPI00262D4F9E|nr:hypothetical protein [uncultured Neisseria sp.]
MVCKTDTYWSQKPKTQYRNLLLPLSARCGDGRRFRQPAPLGSSETYPPPYRKDNGQGLWPG